MQSLQRRKNESATPPTSGFPDTRAQKDYHIGLTACSLPRGGCHAMFRMLSEGPISTVLPLTVLFSIFCSCVTM